jgi:hypothetical protein
LKTGRGGWEGCPCCDTLAQGAAESLVMHVCTLNPRRPAAPPAPRQPRGGRAAAAAAGPLRHARAGWDAVQGPPPGKRPARPAAALRLQPLRAAAAIARCLRRPAPRPSCANPEVLGARAALDCQLSNANRQPPTVYHLPQIGTVREPELRVQIVAERSTFDEDPASEQTKHWENTTTTHTRMPTRSIMLCARACARTRERPLMLAMWGVPTRKGSSRLELLQKPIASRTDLDLFLTVSILDLCCRPQPSAASTRTSRTR